MYYLDQTNSKQHSYPTYGRQFAAYRWYKPIITAFVFAVVYLALYLAGIILVSAACGAAVGADGARELLSGALADNYDDMDVSNTLQNIMSFGSLAIMIPSLWIASLIVRDRPFSSYSSSRGGWNHKVFWKCMPVAFLCIGIPIIVDEVVINGGWNDFQMKFTLASLITLTLLCPLQCIAEEYIFRGLMMQTLGSWVRIPVIAVIVQALIFAAAHPYNNIGKIAIVASGMTFAMTAWLGRGIEVSSAFHICNNMTIFYLMGLNMTTVETNVTMDSLYVDIGTGIAYIAVIFILSRKTNWFDEVRKDDLEKANTKYNEKKALKAAKKAAKAAGKGISAAGTAAGSAAAGAVDRVVDFTAGNADQEQTGSEVTSAAETSSAEEASRAADAYSGYQGRSGRSDRDRTEGKHFKK